jgi:hypothetical protein
MLFAHFSSESESVALEQIVRSYRRGGVFDQRHLCGVLMIVEKKATIVEVLVELDFNFRKISVKSILSVVQRNEFREIRESES